MGICKLCEKEQTTKSFCIKCRIWRRQNGYSYQGIDFTREKVRIRDNQICQECGKKWIEGQRKFDIHHLNGLCGKKTHKYDKVSEMGGLLTLCHKCHYNRPDHSMRINRTYAQE